MGEKMKPLKIEIYSDVICPWCFLGKRRLEKALEIQGLRERAELHFLPFELNPNTPAAGLDHKAHLENKFGGGARVEAAHQRLRELGKSVGIDYRFDLIKRIPNTLKAHRLLWWAGKEGIQIPLKESSMEAYFTQGKDLGDPGVLADLAVSKGLSRERVDPYLAGSEGEEEVRELEERAYQMGITGVPFFVFGGKQGLSGAHEIATFTEILEKL